MNIQSDLTERAIELLALPEDTPAYLLDVGCGSGLSGKLLLCLFRPTIQYCSSK